MQLQNRYIELKNINLSYDCRTILRDVNLLLNRGDFMLVAGANGGGKTSLIRVMLGLQKATQGEVLYYSSNATPINQIRENIGYLPQKNSLDLRFPISIREVVESGLIGVVDSMPKSERESVVEAIMHDMQLDNIQKRQIGEVSGGQFQRALFARAIISNPSLLVLDEPTSYLDKEFTNKLFSTLQKLSPQTTILMVLHDLTQAKSLANRVVLVEDGSVVEQI